MTRKISKFTVRVEDEILKKFCYVAEYNARSANKELEVLMKRHIVEFEKAYGKIIFDQAFLYKIIQDINFICVSNESSSCLQTFDCFYWHSFSVLNAFFLCAFKRGAIVFVKGVCLETVRFCRALFDNVFQWRKMKASKNGLTSNHQNFNLTFGDQSTIVMVRCFLYVEN